MIRIVLALTILAAATASPAIAAFPYTRPGGDPTDFTDLFLDPDSPRPNDLGGDGNTFKYASTPDPDNTLVNQSPVELGGVRGAHLADADTSADQAVHTTLGRPDVTIAVLDSGIKWNDAGAMAELRRKIRLNRGELPVPLRDRANPISSPELNRCERYESAYDANEDGVFNVEDYACDSRVADVVTSDDRRVGPPDVLIPQDVIIAFSDGEFDGRSGGVDDDGNGFVDDIAGWDFFDDDNDAFDDVQYGHGTGEARDSSSEGDNGDALGSCPNCMVVPLRVGDSFIADVNNFAQGVLYATDNNVQVVQEALGALNNSSLARDAVNYAYRHGVTTIASAADEAAQHNNWPSSLPHVILVNSVRDSPIPAPNQSYLSLNGCTNFNSKITLAIPSTSCSSNATGLASGMAGLIYSAAYTAVEKGVLSPAGDSSGCALPTDNPVTAGKRCVITPNEVRQLMASGTIDGNLQADDVNFADGVTPDLASCSPAPLPGCTDPNLALQNEVNANRTSLAPLSPGVLQSYPARAGHDQFFGYGRVNMARAVSALLSDPRSPDDSRIPPEVELESPGWYAQVDPSQPSLRVEGHVYARDEAFTCDIYAAPGHYPNNRLSTDSPPGDFVRVSNGACDGRTSRTEAIDGALGDIDIAALEARFPPGTDFTGNADGGTAQTSNGRINTDPYGFVVKVVATTTGDPVMTGEDQRASFLHRDADMLSGFPKAIVRGAIDGGSPTSDGESSPVLADLDGDNRNELIVAGSDGFVHALTRGGDELPGWPVRGERPPLHLGSRAFRSGEISSDRGNAVVASVAVGDLDRDGVPEVFAADLEGNISGWRADGSRVLQVSTDPAFSGAPLAGRPFEHPRYEPGQSEFRRTAPGFLGSPVIADLDDDGKDEIVAAALDRHVYAWNRDGTPVDGFPLLVVDPSKVESIAPETDQVTFSANSGSLQQGAIVDTPALADLDGDGKPEIVVGTNEEYRAESDGGFNAAAPNGSSGTLIDQSGSVLDSFKDMCGDPCDPIPDAPVSPANSRVYALSPDRAAGGDGYEDAILAGWPAKVGILNGELLPVVGEGITGYPVVAEATCGPSASGGDGPKVGVIANNGAAYVLTPDGKSCFGQVDGRDIPLQSDAGSSARIDHPFFPAVGHPAFGRLAGDEVSFFAPAAGLIRALDVALPEYQRAGQDFLASWSLSGGGQLNPGFPQPINDLQFLTGPSIADIDGVADTQEVVEGSASKDLRAYTALGAPVGPEWPKITTDWTVANPTIGSFGSRDTDAGARKVVIALTRSGYINAYETAAPACSPSDWPRFHHDNANSGDFGRDAILPGKPANLNVAGGSFTFAAPGDDLLCGTPARYDVRSSESPIDESTFGSATSVGGVPAATAAGSSVQVGLAGAERYVAVRAVDDQGNVGRLASVDTGAGTGGGDDGGGGGDDGDGGGGGDDGGGGSPACAREQTGTSRADTLTGDGEGDRIDGRRGDDRLKGRAGEDCLFGRSGEDRIDGDAGNDQLSGGKGRDRLSGDAGDDRLTGGAGPDDVTAGAGDDVISVRGGGRDEVSCGRGDDEVDADRRDRLHGCGRQ